MTSARSTPERRRPRARGTARSRAMVVLTAALLGVVAGLVPRVPLAKPKKEPPRYVFAGIPWLVPADTALARLTARGYREIPAAKDRDKLVCRGRLFEHDAIVSGYLDEQGRLVRWTVLISARGTDYDWPDMRKVFDAVVHESKARYGPPRDVVEKYRFPYERGDGREDNALRDGKATIRWLWGAPGVDRLTVEMDPTCAVVLTYEAPEWAVFDAQRRAKKASDL